MGKKEKNKNKFLAQTRRNYFEPMKKKKGTRHQHFVFILFH